MLAFLIGAAVAGTVYMKAEEKLRDSKKKSPWKSLEPGLDVGIFKSPRAAETGDSRINVLRIDPARFELELLSAAADESQPMTARQWAETRGLAAAINASMYQKDYRTSVSLMKTAGFVNNPRLSKDKAILAFGRQSGTGPPVKMIDRDCDHFDTWRTRYATLVQSIRMISCDGKNVWSQQPRKTSIAAVGTDREDRVLFIHSRSPYSTHDLIDILLDLPIEIARAMYVEGGPQAQLYISSGGETHDLVGQGGSGFSLNNFLAWPIPNVIGVVRK